MGEISVEEEIAKIFMRRPHVLLLGAGASKAALPTGDRNGRPVPILRELAGELDLYGVFPGDLQELSRTDFEAAYSQLFGRGRVRNLSKSVSEYETIFRSCSCLMKQTFMMLCSCA